MNTFLLALLGAIGCCYAAVAQSAFTMTFDNTLTTKSYYVYCNGNSSNAWSLTVNAGEVNSYTKGNLDTNDNNGMTCTITDMSLSNSPGYVPSYIFFYQVTTDGDYVTYPMMNQVYETPIRVCENAVDSHEVTLAINQGAPQPSKTTTTTTLTWTPTIHYAPALAQEVANALARRLEASLTKNLPANTSEYTYSYRAHGSVDHEAGEIRVISDYVVDYAGSESPAGCTDYSRGDSVDFPSPWYYSADWIYWANANWPYWS